MLRHFRAILEEVVEDPDKSLNEISLSEDGPPNWAAAPSLLQAKYEVEQFDF
jgi:hypothetical protein